MGWDDAAKNWLGSKGLTTAVEFAVGNSPITRLATTARQLTDPRKTLGMKALNLGTGMRISQVSPPAQESLTREYASQLLKEVGGRTFTRTYAPSEQELAGLSEADREKAKRMHALLNLLAQKSKDRKEAKQEARAAQ